MLGNVSVNKQTKETFDIPISINSIKRIRPITSKLQENKLKIEDNLTKPESNNPTVAISNLIKTNQKEDTKHQQLHEQGKKTFLDISEISKIGVNKKSNRPTTSKRPVTGKHNFLGFEKNSINKTDSLINSNLREVVNSNTSDINDINEHISNNDDNNNNIIDFFYHKNNNPNKVKKNKKEINDLEEVVEISHSKNLTDNEYLDSTTKKISMNNSNYIDKENYSVLNKQSEMNDVNSSLPKLVPNNTKPDYFENAIHALEDKDMNDEYKEELEKLIQEEVYTQKMLGKVKDKINSIYLYEKIEEDDDKLKNFYDWNKLFSKSRPIHAYTTSKVEIKKRLVSNKKKEGEGYKKLNHILKEKNSEYNETIKQYYITEKRPLNETNVLKDFFNKENNSNDFGGEGNSNTDKKGYLFNGLLNTNITRKKKEENKEKSDVNNNNDNNNNSNSKKQITCKIGEFRFPIALIDEDEEVLRQMDIVNTETNQKLSTNKNKRRINMSNTMTSMKNTSIKNTLNKTKDNKNSTYNSQSRIQSSKTNNNNSSIKGNIIIENNELKVIKPQHTQLANNQLSARSKNKSNYNDMPNDNSKYNMQVLTTKSIKNNDTFSSINNTFYNTNKRREDSRINEPNCVRPKSVYTARNPRDVFYLSKTSNDYFTMDFFEFAKHVSILQAKYLSHPEKLQKVLKEVRMSANKVEEAISQVTRDIHLEDKEVFLASNYGNILPLLKSIYRQIKVEDPETIEKTLKALVAKKYFKSNKPLSVLYEGGKSPSAKYDDDIDYNINLRGEMMKNLSFNKRKLKSKSKARSLSAPKLKLDFYNSEDRDMKELDEYMDIINEDEQYHNEVDVNMHTNQRERSSSISNQFDNNNNIDNINKVDKGNDNFSEIEKQFSKRSNQNNARPTTSFPNNKTTYNDSNSNYNNVNSSSNSYKVFSNTRPYTGFQRNMININSSIPNNIIETNESLFNINKKKKVETKYDYKKNLSNNYGFRERTKSGYTSIHYKNMNENLKNKQYKNTIDDDLMHIDNKNIEVVEAIVKGNPKIDDVTLRPLTGIKQKTIRPLTSLPSTKFGMARSKTKDKLKNHSNAFNPNKNNNHNFNDYIDNNFKPYIPNYRFMNSTYSKDPLDILIKPNAKAQLVSRSCIKLLSLLFILD